MKNIIQTTLFILSVLLVSCVTEDPVQVDASFDLSYIRQGETKALAGKTIYVFPKGSGEFVTVYDGTTGHVFGEQGALGIDMNKADSLPITYYAAGIYKLTVVSSSSTDFGKSFIRQSKTMDVTVVDSRNEIINFSVLGTNATINSTTNEINISMPDVNDVTATAATFTLSSTAAKAYVNGVEQASGVTVNNFTMPLIYTVKSLEGNSKDYTVKVTLTPSSAEKQLLSFQLAKNDPTIGYTNSNAEVGAIDEANKTITLKANYGTNTKSLKMIMTSSPFSKIQVNDIDFNPDRKTYNISIPTVLKVIAQNKTQAAYNLTIVSDNPILDFTFTGLNPLPKATIDLVAKTVTIRVLKGTDITKLVAKWTGSVGTVKIGTVTQVNGVTVNDFTLPKQYTFYKGTLAGDTYTVTVVEV